MLDDEDVKKGNLGITAILKSKISMVLGDSLDWRTPEETLDDLDLKNTGLLDPDLDDPDILGGVRQSLEEMKNEGEVESVDVSVGKSTITHYRKKP